MYHVILSFKNVESKETNLLPNKKSYINKNYLTLSEKNIYFKKCQTSLLNFYRKSFSNTFSNIWKYSEPKEKKEQTRNTKF